MEKQFLVDINPDAVPIKYELTLCKLDEEPLQSLKNITDFETRPYFANIDEISFKVPLHRTQNDGTKIRNELYDLVDGNMLVLVNEMKYFMLIKPKAVSNKKTGETYKEVLGYSREYEFSRKQIIGYEGISRKIYDINNAKDENGLEIGFLNYVERRTSWKVGYVNADIMLKYRGLNFPKVNMLQSFQEVQKTFGCLFKFDTINKIINVYEVTQLGTNQGLYISDRNFINKISQEINDDEIVTRLTLYGQDNISIQKLNIGGQPWIQNLSFFKKTKYMSQNLIDALDAYDAYVLTKEGVFAGYLSQLDTLNTTLSTKKIELSDLISQSKEIEKRLDVAWTTNQPDGTIRAELATKTQEINNKQIEIENVIPQINAIQTNVSNLGNDLSMNTHFTEEQLNDLDPFIHDGDYSDNNYTEENLSELLEDGKKVLARVSYPKVQYTIEVEDFLSLVEGQHFRSKFVLGDLINLGDKDLDIDLELRLVGYVHNPTNKKLSLKFSNRESVDDANIYLTELLENLTTTAGTVNFNKGKWNKGEEANYIINQYVNEAFILAKQQILKAEGQNPIFDERGMWLYKENPDGSIDPAQMRLVNNAIVMTNDNWNSLEWVLSATMGINANEIRGKLGQFAEMQADQIKTGILKSVNNALMFNLDNGTFTMNKGVVTFSENGLKVSHEGTNQYSEIRTRGFKRKWEYGESEYLTDIYTVTSLRSDNELTEPRLIRIMLPERFRNRTNIVAIPISKSHYSGVIARAQEYLRYFETKMNVESIVTNVPIPYVDLYAYSSIQLVNESTNVRRILYYDLSFDLMIIGY